MTSYTTPAISLTKYKRHQHYQQQHIPLSKHKGGNGGKGSYRIKQKYQQHLLAYSIITILVYLCWLSDYVVALKNVSVTIPQAVKRGSNAMLTCNYDMENDTLYSVKWYKGRREFYRYTPKENPAMKVFPSQSGLNVERNLSNQSHVVLLAVPLNISGKFTCEISVEAPSFQTAMVSGEMEVVELPEEQATVTGIQPRYRIGDLVDGNCSIKYSKPAANLTWTINGIVVPPHHIKTYQIEKYEETNLESVMSAIHFMVTTQHFIKGKMRLKCTASIFDIFKEEIESIIEEDRPRIMASGQSYPPDHGYGTHGDTDGYEHNESYLTYFSAPKSSASRITDFIVIKLLRMLKQKILNCHHLLLSIFDIQNNVLASASRSTLVNTMKNYLNQIQTSSSYFNLMKLMLLKFISILTAIILMAEVLRKSLRKRFQIKMMVILTDEKQLSCNCIEIVKQMIKRSKKYVLTIYLWQKEQYLMEKAPQQENKTSYQDASNDGCQTICEQQKQRKQQDDHCLVVENQNVVSENFFTKDTNITTRENPLVFNIIGFQHQLSQTLAFATLLSPDNSTHTIPTTFTSSSLSFSQPSPPSGYTLSCRKTDAHDSFPLYVLDASKSNNAKCMSKDQTLLMTSITTITMTPIATNTALIIVKSTCATPSLLPPLATTTPHTYIYTYKTPLSSSAPTSSAALVLESKLLRTSVVYSLEVVLSLISSSLSLSPPSSLLPFVRNNYLMVFIGEILLHQC